MTPPRYTKVHKSVLHGYQIVTRRQFIDKVAHMQRSCQHHQPFLDCVVIHADVTEIAKKFTQDPSADALRLARQLCCEDPECREFVEII
jgi:hypothetical protein